jgi:predicted dehydrogenase
MEEATMKKVRIGVIGVGGMGQGHCGYMHEVGVGELTAVCDIVPEVAKAVGEKHGVPYFLKSTDLMDSGLVDAVLIATPHYGHPPIAIEAFQRGLHVLSEKPIGVSVKECYRMLRAAERSGKVFGVMFQLRAEPIYQAARKLIKQGAVGELIRTSLILGMYRSQAYYDSAGWRATWTGEGGGVLLNQAPHGLDIFTWLAGVPKHVTANTRTRAHSIEVEDESFALLEYPNGAHGYLFAGVIETPETDRMEIIGDRGKILIDEKGLRYWQVPGSISRFTRENTEMWARPETREAEVKLEKRDRGQPAITRNFCRAILKGEPLLAPGREGIWSLELANAMILSHYRKKTVRIPVNRPEYEDLLDELRAKSRPKRRVRGQRVTDPAHVRRRKR